MLRWALIFLIIALVAALFGFTGIAAAAAEIAKFLFFLFLVVCLIFLLSGYLRAGESRKRGYESGALVKKRAGMGNASCGVSSDGAHARVSYLEAN